MRKLSLCAALLANVVLATVVSAGGPVQYSGEYGGGEDCYCDECGCRHHSLFGNHRNRRNAEMGFNCGCNGSYKYPVPPLYTYHWPGMYSAQLVTDYHSPWRFPPLKPYTDEAPVEGQGALKSLRRVQPAAAVVETHTASGASFAERVEAAFR